MCQAVVRLLIIVFAVSSSWALRLFPAPNPNIYPHIFIPPSIALSTQAGKLLDFKVMILGFWLWIGFWQMTTWRYSFFGVP
jgi:hypothetical protein